MTQKPARKPADDEQHGRHRAQACELPIAKRPFCRAAQATSKEQQRKHRAIAAVYAERQKRQGENDIRTGRIPLPKMALSELPALKALLNSSVPPPTSPAKKRVVTTDTKRTGPARADSCIVEGDIIVTRVGELYAIGRVTADAKTQMFLETRADGSAALKRACKLAGDAHRVFVAHPSRHTTAAVECHELDKPE